MASQTVQSNLALNGVDVVLKGLKTAGNAIQNILNKAGMAGSAIAGLGSFDGFAAGIREAARLGSRISDVAVRTQIAAGDVVILEQAFRNAGLSADKVQTSVARLDKTLVDAKERGGEAAAVFRKLELDVEELLGARPAERFKAVGAAIAGLESPAQRSAVAMKIFGRSGSELLTLFTDPDGFARAERMVGGLAVTLERNADSFDSISDSIDAMGLKSKQFFTGFLGKIDDLVRYWLDRFEQLDFTSAGEKAGALVYVASDKSFAGLIHISDEIKEDSKSCIRGLKELGIRTVMLTGDHKGAADLVSKLLDIDETYYELLPTDKVEITEKLLAGQKSGAKLAFVGDGINDAPVLARADIGIAMGGVGSDAAIEAADVVLMTDEPSKLLTGISISKKTLGIVKENIVFAIGVKVLTLILAAAGIATMWAAVFADVGVAFIAILNAMRALKTR